MTTLAALKADRERLTAHREQQAYAESAAKTLERHRVVAAGLRVRDQALSVLDQLFEHWLLDITGLADETRVHHAMSLAAHEVLSNLAPQIQQAASAEPALADAFNRGAIPRQVLSVSQWAEKNRWLKSGTNSPGQWNNDLTPYLVEIMDSLSEHSPVRQVTFKKSSGVGGTEVMYNWLGYVMHHLQNKDLLVVVPTLELRDRSFNPRLAKMLDESPVLAALAPTSQRNRSNRGDLLEYGARARVIKAGANSPDSLRSDHLPYVICDEVSAFPWDVGGEGDPMTLIDNRQRTFSRAKTYLVSTPTIADACRIDHQFQRSDRRYYHVPCPHCDTLQPLEFGGAEQAHGLKWRVAPEQGQDGPQVVAAWYVCRECGAEIEEKHKPNMLARGRWIAQRPQVKLHRGYHLNALYAPTGLGLNWVKVAQKWLDAQSDTAELKSFVNTYLGEVWREQGDSIEHLSLISRREDYAREQLDLEVVTAWADVQKDRIETSVVGWGAGEEAWLLDHIIIPGDTTQQHVWDELEEVLLEANVDKAGVDSGYNTSMVYAFCARRPWVVATKGVPGVGRPLVEDELKRKQRLRKRRKRGQPVEPLGVDQGKAILYNRLKLEKPGPGYIHFMQTSAFDEEYFAQLAAERLVLRLKGMRTFHEWVQTRPRNEALDCLVGNLAIRRLCQAKVGISVPAVPAGASSALRPAPQSAPRAALAPAVPAEPVAPPAPAAKRPAGGRIALGQFSRFGGATR